MFCQKCGKELLDEAVVCTNCGCAVNGAKQIQKAAAGEDIPNAGWNVLAFLIPIAGLIMFCVMYEKTPIKAKQIGLFALIGFIVNLFFVMIMSML